MKDFRFKFLKFRLFEILNFHPRENSRYTFVIFVQTFNALHCEVEKHSGGMLDLNSIGRKYKPQKLGGNGLVVECFTQDRGAPVQASPASLRCVLEQDTLILA